MKKNLYNKVNDYYKTIFGERVLKIPVDGGFTCPNRDGSKGTGGCIFCSNRGAGDRLTNKQVSEQVKDYFSSFKAKKANKFIVYFQNYTNTYADVVKLKEIYDSSLCDDRIVGLDVATRCDCINEDIAKLLASYKNKYYVQVELGLQSSNEKTHKFTNQLITNNEFVRACEILNKYDIDIVVHIMVGLPSESHDVVKNTVIFLNQIHYKGLKIHSVFIEKNTILHKLFIEGKYTPISYEEYMDELVYILTHIKNNIIIHRITGDPYLPNFVGPEWMGHKKKVLNHIDEILESKNLKQGSLLNEIYKTS